MSKRVSLKLYVELLCMYQNQETMALVSCLVSCNWLIIDILGESMYLNLKQIQWGLTFCLAHLINKILCQFEGFKIVWNCDNFLFIINIAIV